MMLNNAPVVDYAAHPPFVGPCPGLPDAEADRLISEIEASYEELCGIGHPVAERQARFDRDIASRMSQLETHLAARMRPRFTQPLAQVFAVTQSLLRDDLIARGFGDIANTDLGDPIAAYNGVIAVAGKDRVAAPHILGVSRQDRAEE